MAAQLDYVIVTGASLSELGDKIRGLLKGKSAPGMPPHEKWELYGGLLDVTGGYAQAMVKTSPGA